MKRGLMLLQIGMTSRYQNSPPDYTQNHAVVPLGAARTDHHLDTGLTVGCPVMRDRVKVKFPQQILKPASSRRLSNLGSRPRKASSLPRLSRALSSQSSAREASPRPAWIIAHELRIDRFAFGLGRFPSSWRKRRFTGAIARSPGEVRPGPK